MPKIVATVSFGVGRRGVSSELTGDKDTVMRDAECDGLENDRSPMDSDTYERHPIDDFSD